MQLPANKNIKSMLDMHQNTSKKERRDRRQEFFWINHFNDPTSAKIRDNQITITFSLIVNRN